MIYRNPVTGTPVFEESVLLRIGKEPPYDKFPLDINIRQAVREMQSRTKGIPMEYGSPSRHPNQTDESWLRRIRSINPEKVCGLITDIRMAVDRKRPGEAFITGRIEPKGPYGVHLRDLLLSDADNFRYRMRYLRNSSGLQRIITFDLVSE